MSSSDKEVGVVVVGLGIAGKARVKDLKQETCGLRLRGVVSRRPVELEGVKGYTLEEALADTTVDAVFISTEPARHEECIRKSLENGKHVLVEYPLVLTSDIAKELFKLAEEKGVILREENVALLTPAFIDVKKKALTTQLQSASYSLKGKFNGWLEKFEESGPPFISGLGHIQVLMSLFGQLSVEKATMDRHDDGYTATAHLKTTDGSPITMTMARFPEQQRSKEQVYNFVDGEVLDTNKMEFSTPMKVGLFLQDSHIFYKAVVDGKMNDEEKTLTISSLELAEKIHSYF